MESKNFVKQQVERLAKKYPFSKIKYYFDSFDNDHFVCVGLRSDLDKILSTDALEIDKNFIELFPKELLSFIQIDDDMEFDELVFESEKIGVIETDIKNLQSFKIDTTNNFEYTQSIEISLKSERKINSDYIPLYEDEYAFAA